MPSTVNPVFESASLCVRLCSVAPSGLSLTAGPQPAQRSAQSPFILPSSLHPAFFLRDTQVAYSREKANEIEPAVLLIYRSPSVTLCRPIKVSQEVSR